MVNYSGQVGDTFDAMLCSAADCLSNCSRILDAGGVSATDIEFLGSADPKSLWADLGNGMYALVDVGDVHVSAPCRSKKDYCLERFLEQFEIFREHCFADCFGTHFDHNPGRVLKEQVLISMIGQTCRICVKSIDDRGLNGKRIVVSCPSVDEKILFESGKITAAITAFMDKRSNENAVVDNGVSLHGFVSGKAEIDGRCRVMISVRGFETCRFALTITATDLASHPRLKEMFNAYGTISSVVNSDFAESLVGEYDFNAAHNDRDASLIELSSTALNARVSAYLVAKQKQMLDAFRHSRLLIDGSNVLLRNEQLNWRTIRTLIETLRRHRIPCELFFDATIWNKLTEMKEHKGIEFLRELMSKRPDFVHIVPAGSQADDYILMRADKENFHIISDDTFRQQEYRERYTWLANRKESGLVRVHRFDVIDGRLVVPDLLIYEKVV